jgi:hypothetical protein
LNRERPLLPCSLCFSNHTKPFFEADRRTYFLCPSCSLLFLPEAYWPSAEEERARYDKHQNSPDDNGYVAFLNMMAVPLVKLLAPGAKGLDYGSGPSPVLSDILNKKGYPTQHYDPVYFPDLPKGPYDFIVSTEVFEHFRFPREEIQYLRKLLPAGGFLGIMTSLWDEKTFRDNWHYRRDITHLCFYNLKTIEQICGDFDFKLTWTDHERVHILRKL